MYQPKHWCIKCNNINRINPEFVIYLSLRDISLYLLHGAVCIYTKSESPGNVPSVWQLWVLFWLPGHSGSSVFFEDRLFWFWPVL